MDSAKIQRGINTAKITTTNDLGVRICGISIKDDQGNDELNIERKDIKKINQ